MTLLVLSEPVWRPSAKGRSKNRKRGAGLPLAQYHRVDRRAREQWRGKERGREEEQVEGERERKEEKKKGREEIIYS